MGWNTSLIIIEDKENITDREILFAIGFSNAEFVDSQSFNDVIYPKENTIAIGNYNGNIIVSDGFCITNQYLENAGNLNLNIFEKNITRMLPYSEILTVACISSVNYHGYSLIENAEKTRLKVVTPEHKIEFGTLFKEEEHLYNTAIEKDKVLYFTENGEEYTEDQLMEDFTFEITKRRLGVRLDTEEGDELMETNFRVYAVDVKPITGSKKFKWKFTLAIIIILIIYQIIIRLF